jgi:hypothetical protein
MPVEKPGDPAGRNLNLLCMLDSRVTVSFFCLGSVAIVSWTIAERGGCQIKKTVMLRKNFFYLSFVNNIIMRTFLVNFMYSSAGQYNADFVLFTQGTFPTSLEINRRIQSTAIEKGLQFHGPLLWTGITELNEGDEGQFNLKEE